MKFVLLALCLASVGLCQIVTAPAFAADCVMTASMIPFPVKGALNFDVTAQVQRITISQFGQKTVEIDRFNESKKYVFASAFGVTKCATCFIKPPVYPLYVPPGAVYVRNETANGYNCAVYSSDMSGFGLNMTFWVSNVGAPAVIVRGQFEVGGLGGMPTITTTMDLSNIKPGPQDPSLFVPPSDCSPQAVCAAKANLALVVDGSGSIAAPDFAKDKLFLAAILGSFKIAGDETAVALIQYSSTVRVEVGLSGDAAALKSAVGAMTQMSGGTATGLGIEAAMGEFAKRQADANLIVIITDGQSNEGPDPIAAAQQAKDSGSEIFCIGVGSGVDMTQLNAMASQPLATHVFTVTDFSKLNDILNTVVSASCPGGGTCQPDFGASVKVWSKTSGQ